MTTYIHYNNKQVCMFTLKCDIINGEYYVDLKESKIALYRPEDVYRVNRFNIKLRSLEHLDFVNSLSLVINDFPCFDCYKTLLKMIQ